MLYTAVELAPSAELVDPEMLTRYFTKFDEKFFHYSDKELTKINTFYSGRYLTDKNIVDCRKENILQCTTQQK